MQIVLRRQIYQHRTTTVRVRVSWPCAYVTSAYLVTICKQGVRMMMAEGQVVLIF